MSFFYRVLLCLAPTLGMSSVGGTTSCSGTAIIALIKFGA
jgi:hypothetical protein